MSMETSGPQPARHASRRAGRRRTDVLAAAGRVIAERGIESTRFSDVSAAAAVPVSTLQYFFGNREDLIIAVFRQVGAEETARLRSVLDHTDEADPWEQLIALLRIGVADDTGAAATTWRLWVELWRWALRDEELREDALDVARQWRELVAGVIERGQRLGRFTADADPATVATQAVCLVDGIGIPAALGDPALPGSGLDLVVDAVARLLQVSDP